jgi:hypothetical protein
VYSRARPTGVKGTGAGVHCAAMSEQTTSASVGQQELREELDRRQEEILRLRDLLIGKEAELGAVKGKLAALEDPRMQLAGVKQMMSAQLLGRLRGVLLRLRGPSS